MGLRVILAAGILLLAGLVWAIASGARTQRASKPGGDANLDVPGLRVLVQDVVTGQSIPDAIVIARADVGERNERGRAKYSVSSDARTDGDGLARVVFPAESRDWSLNIIMPRTARQTGWNLKNYDVPEGSTEYVVRAAMPHTMRWKILPGSGPELPDGTHLKILAAVDFRPVNPPPVGRIEGDEIVVSGWAEFRRSWREVGRAVAPDGSVARLQRSRKAGMGVPTKFEAANVIDLTVRLPNGELAVGVLVGLRYELRGFEWTQTTDAAGCVRFGQLLPGLVNLSIPLDQARGFYDSSGAGPEVDSIGLLRLSGQDVRITHVRRAQSTIRAQTRPLDAQPPEPDLETGTVAVDDAARSDIKARTIQLVACEVEGGDADTQVFIQVAGAQSPARMSRARNTGRFQVFVGADARFTLHAIADGLVATSIPAGRGGGTDFRIRLAVAPALRFEVPTSAGEPVAVLGFNRGRLFAFEPNLFDGDWQVSGIPPGPHKLWILFEHAAPLLLPHFEMGAANRDLGLLSPPRGSTLKVRVLVNSPFVAPTVGIDAVRIDVAGFPARETRKGSENLTLPNLGAGRYRVDLYLDAFNRRFEREVELDGKRDKEIVIDLRHPDQR